MAPADPLRRIREASAALILFEHKGGVSIGSAIGVRVGDRTLLATAAHNLRRLKDVRPISRGRYRSDPMRALASDIGRAPDGDVGWVEVRSSEARRSGLRAVDIRDLETRYPAPETRLTAFGFPASGLDPSSFDGTRFDLPGQEVSGWWAATARKPGRDIALSYPAAGSAFRPAGLSGAGMWSMGAGGQIQLVALARAWHPESRSLLGTPISRWLKLVRRSFR